MESYLPTANSSELLVIDWETTGLDPWKDEIVGVAIADKDCPQGIYFSRHEANSRGDWWALMMAISQRPKIAHNVTFELLMERQWWSNIRPPNYRYCTQGLLNQFEGDESQRCRGKLKELQQSALGWTERGDVELKQVLLDAGIVTAKGKADMSRMSLAPLEVLGRYSALDAQATWALYTKFYRPHLDKFPDLDHWHTTAYMTHLKLIVEQRLRGMVPNRKGLTAHIENLEHFIAVKRDTILYDSEATPYFEAWMEEQRDVVRRRPEPDMMTKTGKVSKRWETWSRRMETFPVPEPNLNSKQLMGWLFYDCLFETSVEERQHWRKGLEKWLTIQASTGPIELKCTPSGQRPIDKDTLPKLGPVGVLLHLYNHAIKELGYVKGMVGSLTESGVHHVQLRPEATVTGRSAGTGGVNIQQLPKSREYLECLVPRPGYKFLQMDINALEPNVLAEMSECPSYMKLYGPGRPPNDVYLFIASQIEMFRDEILKHYNPDAPTEEGITTAKKFCKRIRSICKIIHLAAGYGAGVFKIWRTLLADGIDISQDEVDTIYQMYWQVFKAVKDYQQKLGTERQACGYNLDALGCPFTVTEMYAKDILNRTIQNSGHKILLKWTYWFDQGRGALDLHPVVNDYHDEVVWEVSDKDAEAALALANQTWYTLNQELGGIIPLAGEPQLASSFADFKL